MCVDVSSFLIKKDNSTILPGNGSIAYVYEADHTYAWTNYTLPRDLQFIFYLAEGDEVAGLGR